jgi:hypothetical protein
VHTAAQPLYGVSGLRSPAEGGLLGVSDTVLKESETLSK